MWIPRDLAKKWNQTSLPVRILRGLRQCGKTSFLEHIYPQSTVARMDDLGTRRLAQDDPALFLKQHSPASRSPLIIDEAQYAPHLFPEIKRQVDHHRRQRLSEGSASEIPPLFLISGSNQTLLTQGVRESLAGRASFYNLHTLSIREILSHNKDFSVFDYFLSGGWPELKLSPQLSVVNYLNDYISTFIEKDIAQSAGIEKLNSFETALGLLAARTGQQLNVSEVAGQSGVESSTLRDWISVLEQNQIVDLLQPYSSNLSKRLVKTPKLYFLEASLATRLQGWSDLPPLLKSPSAGPLFETLVYSEIVRTLDHGCHSVKLYYLRTREGQEVDFLLVAPNSRFLLIEAKMGIQSVSPIVLGSELKKVIPSGTPSWVVTPDGPQLQIAENCIQIPITNLADQLELFLR